MTHATHADDTTATTIESIREQADPRTIRALTEPLDIDPNPVDAWSEFEVDIYSKGRAYRVNADAGSCECPDFENRRPEGGCKHVRRARYCLGISSVPSWVNYEALDVRVRDRRFVLD